MFKPFPFNFFLSFIAFLIWSSSGSTETDEKVSNTYHVIFFLARAPFGKCQLQFPESKKTPNKKYKIILPWFRVSLLMRAWPGPENTLALSYSGTRSGIM